MKNEIKTIFFAGLIAAMILPFSAMDYPIIDVPEAFAMQHVMSDDMHFQGMDLSTKRIINETTHMLRDSKATSFNLICFDRSYSNDEIQDRTFHRR